jgi:phage gpG-like protein
VFDLIMIPPARIEAAAFMNLSRQFRSYKEPLTRSVRNVMTKSLYKNFIVRGRPRWAPLSEATLNTKQYGPHMAGYLDAPLIRTGALWKAAGQINLWSITSTDATATGGPDYGAFHQSGTVYMPARPWAVIQPEDETAIALEFDKWMVEKLAIIP